MNSVVTKGIISFNTEDESKAFIKGMEHMATIYEMERNNYDIDISEKKAKKVVQSYCRAPERGLGKEKGL